MSYAYAPSSPAEAPFITSLFSKSTKHAITNRNNMLSFRPRNPSSSRRTIRIHASYAPVKTTETLYELLGISESETTLLDIKKAYKQMARKYHPDVSPPDQVDEHTKKFIMVQRAYETLSDPKTRAMYDRELGNRSSFAYSTRSTSYHYNEKSDETEAWRARWNSQMDELKQRSMSPNHGGGTRMTWGSRMRNQR